MDESDDDDADTVSITSTVPSEARSDYEFEEIISETKVRGTKYYLVSWTNYNLDESTWEPVHHFDDPEQALKNWEETKAAIERGEKRPVDIYKIRRKAIDREIAAQKRRLRRRAKRKSLGLPVDSESEIELTPADFDQWEPSEPSDDDRGNGDEDEEEEEEEELRSQPIWAAFKPIRFRRPLRRPIATTPRRQSSIVSADSSSSKQSRAAEDEEKQQTSKPQPAVVTARIGAPFATPSTRGQTRQTGAPSSPRPRQPERRTVGRNESAASTTRSESNSSGPNYIIPVAESSSSTSKVFDPRQPSSAQRVLANIKSKKQNRSAQNQGYMYKRLSTVNRARKAAREEPPPDINQLEFFTPGQYPQPVRHQQLQQQQQERQRRNSNIFERGRDDTRPAGSPRENELPARWRGIDQGNGRPPIQSWPTLPPTGPRSLYQPGASSVFIPKRMNRPPLPQLGRKKRAFRKDKEALLYLRTEEKVIGHVKIGETPPAVIDMLSRLTQKEYAADFVIHDMCTISQYHALCKQESNTLMAGGYVKPFDDTLRALRDFTQDLRTKRQAALFYHPEGEVFILYPAEVEEWKFLNRGNFPSVVGVELRYALSTSFPRLSELPPGTADKPIELGDDATAGVAGFGHGRGGFDQQGSESFAGFDDELQDVIADVTMRDVSPEPAPAPAPVPAPTLAPRNELNIAALDKLDKSGVISLFEEKFHISFDQLTAVNGDPRRARFVYLGFPEETTPATSGVEREFEFLQVALEKCGMELFSNIRAHQYHRYYSHHPHQQHRNRIRPGNDWVSFRRTTENDPGTVLFHETFSDFPSLLYFARSLRQHINVFYVSLARPLVSTVDAHFDMIFPHGGAILLTDEVILRTPKRALAIVRWFIDHAKTRTRGTWKMVFRPNVSNWLLDLLIARRMKSGGGSGNQAAAAAEEENEDEKYLVEMYRAINECTPWFSRFHLGSYNRGAAIGGGSELQPSLLDDDAYIYHAPNPPEQALWEQVDEGQHFNPFLSPKYIPRYGVRRDSEVDEALRGADDETKNTDHLIEWFAGWSLMNAERFRRFTVVVNVKTKVLERWKRWTHIEVLDSRRFIGQHTTMRKYDPFKEDEQR